MNPSAAPLRAAHPAEHEADDPPAAARRPRGRPRKTVDELADGNRRHELLAPAGRLFRLQGFDATSTRDIAAASGMRSGSPFYHFDSKQALLGAVMEEGMVAAIARQARALREAGCDADMLLKSEQETTDPRGLLAVLIRHHFDVLLGPGSDFIPVMLYEWRSLTDAQRADLARLQGDYEAPWVPVLTALQRSGQLRGDAKLARLMIFGALNWSVQWYDAGQNASLDDLAEAALALFVAPQAQGGT